MPDTASAANAARGAAGGWRAVVTEMVEGSAAALRRFPVVAAILALAALTANLFLADRGSGIGWFTDDRIYPLCCAALASLAATLLGESRFPRHFARHGAALAAGAFAYALVEWDGAFSTYHLALVPALLAFVALAPFVGRFTGLAFWLFSLRLGFATGLALLALLLLAGGLSAIIASLTYLFGLPIPERIHGHVWATAGLLIAPAFGLGQIPARFEEPAGGSVPDHLARGMRVLGDYVAAPLLTVYAVILHAYALKIVLTGDVPQGQVGWLVLGFGLWLFAALTLIHPFLETGRAPTRFLMRFWPLMLPVPIALLVYAALLRIGVYGVTPERYMLLLFAGVAALLTLLQVTRLRGDIRIMVGLPALALFLAAFGPQGAVAVSVESQVKRFAALVAEQPVPLSRHGEALSVLDFLNGRGALQRVSPVALDQAEPAGLHYRRVAVANGIDPDFRQLGETGRFAQSLRVPNVINAAGFDVVLSGVSLSQNENMVLRTLPAGGVLRLSLAEDGILVSGDGSQAAFALPRDALEDLVTGGPAEAPRLILRDGGREIVLIVTFIGGRLEGDPVVDALNGTILLRSGDWPAQGGTAPEE